jgi:hypothetical protein
MKEIDLVGRASAVLEQAKEMAESVREGTVGELVERAAAFLKSPAEATAVALEEMKGYSDRRMDEEGISLAFVVPATRLRRRLRALQDEEAERQADEANQRGYVVRIPFTGYVDVKVNLDADILDAEALMEAAEDIAEERFFNMGVYAGETSINITGVKGEMTGPRHAGTLTAPVGIPGCRITRDRGGK